MVVNATQCNVLHHTAPRFVGLTTYLPTYLTLDTVGREVNTCSYFHAEQPSVCEAPKPPSRAILSISVKETTFPFPFLFCIFFF